MNLTKSGAHHAHSHAYAKQRQGDVLPPFELALSNITTAIIALEVAVQATGYDLRIFDELATFEQWCKEQKR